MNLFRSKTRRKAEKMFADLLYQRCEIRKELDTMKITDTKAYCRKLIDDDKLKTQINVLIKLLE